MFFFGFFFYFQEVNAPRDTQNVVFNSVQLYNSGGNFIISFKSLENTFSSFMDMLGNHKYDELIDYKIYLVE